MYAATTFQRTPLVIAAGNLVAGPVHATFRDGDRESLLHSYLVMVRRLRGQQRVPSITLRSDDICAIAGHLGVSEDRVLDDLLDRMGATRAQRKALLAMFAMGALSIVATGSVALDLAPTGALAQGSSDVAPVTETVELSTSPLAGVSVADAAPVVGVSVADATPVAAADAAPAGTLSAEVFPAPELAIAVGGPEWEFVVSVQQLTNAMATQPVAESTAAQTETAVAGVGVADDGSIVAVVDPPLPMPEGVGVADDGSIVAVAPPPVP